MITKEIIEQMDYVDFMALLDEVNRPPGGKDSIRLLVQNSFLSAKSNVLDVGCNTGFCTFEIAEIAKCKVTGLDINKNMIDSAKRFLLKEYPDLKRSVTFTNGDGMSLPFKDNTFDLVMSGGSTAFIPNISRALDEYKRVTKLWGFIGDINFYYHTKPPAKLLKDLNSLMVTSIEPWGVDYWLDLYRNAGLEMYFHTFGKMQMTSMERIKEYCALLARQKKWTNDVKDVVLKKLTEIMKLFNENHKYLAYGVFIMRKRPEPEVALFY